MQLPARKRLLGTHALESPGLSTDKLIIFICALLLKKKLHERIGSNSDSIRGTGGAGVFLIFSKCFPETSPCRGNGVLRAPTPASRPPQRLGRLGPSCPQDRTWGHAKPRCAKTQSTHKQGWAPPPVNIGSGLLIHSFSKAVFRESPNVA